MEIMLPDGKEITIEIEERPVVTISGHARMFIVAVIDGTCVAFELSRSQQAFVSPYLYWVLRAVRANYFAQMVCVVNLEPWYIEDGSVATLNHAVFSEILPDRRKHFLTVIDYLEYMSHYAPNIKSKGKVREAIILDGKTTTMRRMHPSHHVWMWWRKGEIVYDKID